MIISRESLLLIDGRFAERSRLDAGSIFHENEAPARDLAWFQNPLVGGRTTTTTAPARYFLKNYSGTPWPGRPQNSGRALSFETSLQFSQAGEGPATTTTALARYFLVIYCDTPRRERPPNSRQALSLETSSQVSQVGEPGAGTKRSPPPKGVVS